MEPRINHNVPCNIQDLAPDPERPSTKSDPGPRAFSSMKETVPFATSENIHNPL